MAIDLYWEDESLTTLLCIFDGRWTWDELRAVFKTIQHITADVPHEVSAIIDVRKMQLNMGDIFNPQGLDFAREIVRMGQGGTGRIVVVGANKVLSSIFETLCAMDRKATAKVHFADTQHHAREKLGLLTP